MSPYKKIERDAYEKFALFLKTLAYNYEYSNYDLKLLRYK